MDDASHGESILRLVVLDAVAADQKDAGLPHLVQAAPEDLAEDFHVHLPDGKADDVQRGERPPPHGVDVAERVRHGNLAECVRIVHDRGEEIDGLDDGQIRTKAVDPGVFRMLHPHDQVRIGDERQILQRFLQVTRTYLAGSPRPVDRPGQAHLHFLVHVRSPFRFSAHCREGRRREFTRYRRRLRGHSRLFCEAGKNMVCMPPWYGTVSGT